MAKQKSDIEKLIPDSLRRTADIAVKEIELNPSLLKPFIDLAIAHKGVISARAANVVKFYAVNHQHEILPFLHEIVDKMPGFEIVGLRRNFMKLFLDIDLPNDDEILGKLTDIAFQWLTSQQTPAVKAYSAAVLQKIAKKEPDLIPELLLVLDEQRLFGTVGFKAYIKKIVKDLQKNKS